MASKPDEELLWKQYQLHIDLHKFYIDATIKLNAFHYAITGAILSFYFTRSEIALAKWSLIFPIALSVGLGILFVYGAQLLKVTWEDVFKLRDTLGFEVAPEMNVLRVLLGIMATLQSLTAFAITLLVIYR